VVVIDYDYDYLGVSPGVGFVQQNSVEFLDSTDPIKLEITYTPAGYSNKVVGVVGASIGKVIGVSSANISKVIGVQ
jgi:hypothetical protein